MKAPAASGAAPLVCIAGPTASGKSRAALALAERWRGVRAVEIVSVDSAQVYRGLDIGTAKPSAAERAAVPHHLIDVVDPAERWSAARFVAAAREAIAAIQARRALPLLVGGSMLYVDALFRGLDALPQADLAVRAAIDARAASLGWPALHGELGASDPAAAARIAPHDAQRIQRALEVLTLTGRPISSFHRRTRTPLSTPPLITLEPTDRAWLTSRIAARFDAMLAAGLVDEVRRLRARGDLTLALPSMRAVGYRQVWEALDRGDGDTARLRERAIAATRQLAKRQLTWLRSWPERIVVPCDAPDAIERVVAQAAARLD